MRALILFSIVAMFCQESYALDMAPDGPTRQEINEVRDQTDSLFFSMNGVNGVGTSACESETGLKFVHIPELERTAKVFENCISISTETEEAKDALKVLFPVGTRYQGIFIVVEFAGKFSIGG